MEVPINLWAVLVGGVGSFILGWIWYGPLFGKQYMHYMGTTMEEAQQKMKDSSFRTKMMRNYALVFILALITAFVLDHAVIYAFSYMQWSGWMAGGIVGALNWIGFVVPATSNLVLFDKKSWGWWFLVNGYYLIQLVLLGILFAVWM